MIATLPRAVLAPLLKRAAEVARRSTTSPVLGHVKLEARAGALHVSATDLERALTTQAPAQVDREGSICVPAKELSSVMDRLPREDVTLRTSKTSRLKVESGRASFDLVGMAGETFPQLPDVGSVALHPIPGAALRDALDRAGYAASSDENRPNLCAVSLGGEGAQATDGHRASWVQVEGIEGLGPQALLLPADSLRELARVAADADKIEVGSDATWFVLRAHGITVSARLYDGKFPDLANVMPASLRFHATFDRQALLDALGRAKIFGEAPMRLILRRGSEAILRTRAHGDIPGLGSGSEFEEMLPAEVDGEAPEEIGASLPLLIAAVRAIQGEDIEIGGNTELDPLVLCAPGDAKNRHIVMPMRC